MMSILILQIVIKQWDKSQLTEKHILDRASIPDKYPVVFPPAFYVFNEECVIDKHGDDLQGDRIKYSKSADGKIKIDRFQVCPESFDIEYLVSTKSDTIPEIIGSLDNQWVRCKYNWRYGILENDMNYWLYEEVTLNAIRANELSENVFLNIEPAIFYVDPNFISKKKKG
jgi:hypothetical protein